MTRTQLILAAALGLVVLVPASGCGDPPSTAPSATVGSAKPVPPPPPPKSGASATGTDAAPPAPADASKPAKPAGAFDVGPADSKIGFTGTKVKGSHDGVFQKFSGWIYIDGDKLDTARVFIDIDVSSLKTDSEMLDGHLKKDDFFAVDKHPNATFQLTELKADTSKGGTHQLTGNLKMRGVEKSVSFPATVTLAADGVTATAKFQINRRDWGIAYDGQKDNLIKDDVEIRLDLKAKKA